MELPPSEMGSRLLAEQVTGENQELCLDEWSLRCLSEILVKILRRQLDRGESGV